MLRDFTQVRRIREMCSRRPELSNTGPHGATLSNEGVGAVFRALISLGFSLQRTTLHFVLLASLLATVRVAAQAPCTVETVAGAFAGPPPGDGGPGPLAELVRPEDVRVWPDGAIYVSDSRHHVIRRIGADGIIETFAGTGARGFSGDGGPATEARLISPTSMAFGPDGSLYFKDDTRIRRVDPGGVISTVAGNGKQSLTATNTPALETSADTITTITVDSQGVLYGVSVAQHQVYRIGPDGILTLFAGKGLDETGRAASGTEGQRPRHSSTRHETSWWTRAESLTFSRPQ